MGIRSSSLCQCTWTDWTIQFSRVLHYCGPRPHTRIFIHMATDIGANWGSFACAWRSSVNRSFTRTPNDQ